MIIRRRLVVMLFDLVLEHDATNFVTTAIAIQWMPNYA
jgi:hypothetical protein